MSRIQYLLRDDFKTDEAAPLTSPRVCEPGPGTLAVSDPDNRMSIVDGTVVVSTTGSNALLTSSSMAHTAGRAMFFNARRDNNGFHQTGWGNGTAQYTMFEGNGVRPGPADQVVVTGGVDATLREFVIIRRETGGFYYIRDGALEWVQNTGTTGNLNLWARANSGIGVWDDFRILDLAELDPIFGDKSELATSKIDGSVTAGQTFTHEADFVMEWTQTTLGASRILFRRQDSANYWYAATTTTGALSLNEVIAGVPSIRTSISGVVEAGHRIVIIAEGTTIRGYSNNTLRWTYSSAINFQAGTFGKRNDQTDEGLTGTSESGQISNLRAWPASIDVSRTGDYSLATSRIPGSVTAGQTFTHEADFVMEWTQTLPTSGFSTVYLRSINDNNGWAIYNFSDGRLSLYERVNGVDTLRYASATGTMVSGHRVVLIFDGTTIRFYSNNILRTTYSAATNFQTATSGKMVSAGTGGTISNLVTYPRHIEMPYLDDKQSLFGSRLFGSKLFGGTL